MYPALVFLLLVGLLTAEVSPGDNRAQVEDVLGKPQGVARTGNVESLMYDNVRVTLRDGVVVEVLEMADPVEVKQTSAEAVPETERITAPESKKSPTADLPYGWFTDYQEAVEWANKTNLPIFALFTGSDWCGPCIQFQNTVGDRSRFLDYAQERVVLLKVDFPRNRPQPDQVRKQNEELANRHGVRAFPTFMLLDAEGNKKADFSRPGFGQQGDPIDRYINNMEIMLGGASGSIVTQPWFRIALVILIVSLAVRWLRK